MRFGVAAPSPYARVAPSPYARVAPSPYARVVFVSEIGVVRFVLEVSEIGVVAFGSTGAEPPRVTEKPAPADGAALVLAAAVPVPGAAAST
ncbi:hypothetical protein ACEN85_19705, partial [Curtobacterium sp. CT11-45]|uniref:hypothetical protein n=1 Tax=Curtobacterium sp. CT11-45 TaxID=3243037 RepID=UPI0039AF6306